MGGGWGRWIGLGAAALAIAFGVAWLVDAEAEALDRDDRMHLVYSGLLAVVLLSGLAVHLQHRPKAALGQAAAWIGVGLALVLGYSFRFEAAALWDRIAGELSPGRGLQATTNSIRFRAANDGHFHVSATVDGAAVRFLVDTGASLVVLSPADARRIGFDIEKLNFTMRFGTANGEGMGAPVRLRELRVGPIVVRDVRAAVNQAPMAQSLLGVSFLERLARYEVREGTLTLER